MATSIRADSPGKSRLARWNAISVQRYEDQLLLVLTLVIGAVVGLVVVAFILLTENLGSRLYPASGAPWRRLVIPVAGSLFAGFFLARYFPNARGSGIPQTKAALFIRDGFIRFRTVVGKFSMCSITLASGIALGREGPSVQVSAGIASVLGRRFGMSTRGVKSLVPVGAAAAIAAAFNTPIAAVLFTLEEVMGDMHAPVLGSIVLSSATSWAVLHLLLGDTPLFHVPAYQLVHPVEFLFYAILGVAGGLVSVAFVKLLLWQRKYFLKSPNRALWLQPAVGGLVVGVLGWFVPQVLGVGYGFVDQALNGKMVVATMALLVCLKLVATATCYASGNAGGIFGPSLFIGAMMGGAVGGAAHMLMPDYTGSAGAYALVGMGAAFAGIVRAPLTSVIMIFEITRDYSIIVPLMIANLLSYFLSSRLQEEPIYDALQHQDGLHMPAGARARQDLLMVGHALSPGGVVLAADELILQAASRIDRERGAWPVVDEAGLRGMVTLERLEQAIEQGRGQQALREILPEPGPAEELTETNFPHVHADDSVDFAMRRLAESGLPALPVVSRADTRELKGSISVADILATYGIGGSRDRAEEVTEPELKSGGRLLAGALAALVGLGVLIGTLNYFYRTGSENRARHYYQSGNTLMLSGRVEEAIEQYRNALSASRKPDYRLALGLALANAGQQSEASLYLKEVLLQNPASGPANLGMATVLGQEGEIDRAALSYQRAIDGSWPEDARQGRFQARIELAQMLAKAAREPQAQAALLAAAAAIPNDPARKKELGRLLTSAGLPREAIALFRDVLQHDGRDVAASDGLGDAEFALSEYAQALEAYRGSLALNPADEAARRRIETCDQILTLDPAMPGLGAVQRFERARRLLDGVLEQTARCADGADTRQARAELARRKRPPSYSDAASADLALAEKLWSERSPACRTSGDPESPLSRVMAKLAR